MARSAVVSVSQGRKSFPQSPKKEMGEKKKKKRVQAEMCVHWATEKIQLIKAPDLPLSPQPVAFIQNE